MSSVPQLQDELYRVIARHVRYPTEQEKAGNPRAELECQADLLNMMKASKLLHEQCEITLYAHPVIEDFDHFLNTGEAPSAQDRWKHVRSLQVSHQQYSYESLTDDDVSYVRLIEPMPRYNDRHPDWLTKTVQDASKRHVLATLFPRLQRVIVKQARPLSEYRSPNPDPYGEPPRIDIFAISTAAHHCQTSHNGQLDVGSLPPFVVTRPEPSRSVFTFHPPSTLPTRIRLGPVLFGAHNRCIYPIPPQSAGPSHTLLDKISRLARGANQGFRSYTLFRRTRGATEDDVAENHPDHLKHTTQIELFGFISLEELDPPQPAGWPSAISSFESAQKYLDDQMGVWAGIIVLRPLKKAPPCAACGKQWGVEEEVETA